jgi:RNase adaptor protein for sRNA GlmZ degradation
VRTWPAPPRVRHNPIPADADRAQAAAVGEVLAGLIADCEAKLAALAVSLDAARSDERADSARRIEAQILNLQSELAYLKAMARRLVRRFRDTTCGD